MFFPLPLFADSTSGIFKQQQEQQRPETQQSQAYKDYLLQIQEKLLQSSPDFDLSFLTFSPLEVTEAVLCQENKEKEKKQKEEETPLLRTPQLKLIWTEELETKFQEALLHCFPPTPQIILQFMNVPGLTRDNISSHLQKYRLRKLAKAQQQKERMITKRRTFSLLPSSKRGTRPIVAPSSPPSSLSYSHRPSLRSSHFSCHRSSSPLPTGSSWTTEEEERQGEEKLFFSSCPSISSSDSQQLVITPRSLPFVQLDSSPSYLSATTSLLCPSSIDSNFSSSVCSFSCPGFYFPVPSPVCPSSCSLSPEKWD